MSQKKIREHSLTAEKIMSGDFPRGKRLEELEGKCMALWVQSGGETSKWNGDSCDCELIQGTYNCKLNPF